MLKTCILALMLLALSCSGANAEGAAGGQFLRIGVGAKATALGEAGSTASGAQSMFYNPAGLSDVKDTEFSFSQVKWIMDINYSNLALARKSAAGVYGLAVNYLSAPSIGKYDKYGNQLMDSYSVRDMAVTFGYGRQATPRRSWGLDIKYISSRLESASAGALALDAGIKYDSVPGVFNMGFVLQNLGTQLKYLSDNDPLPLNIKAGGRYLFRTEDGTGDRNAQNVSVLADLNYMKGPGYYANLGLELMVNYTEGTLCALRGGYKTHAGGGAGGLSFGFGVDTKKYAVDYAYSPMGDLGKAHRLSLTLRFAGKAGDQGQN
ncbi:MAG: PorV/PorQ family protein [Elusimicrobia bacterium]|nr:PorV/PorQ family protein [Elusimicrobiota bacterium]